MLPTDTDGLRQNLTHADAVIVELHGVVAEFRKKVESQQAHIDRLVTARAATPSLVPVGVCTATKELYTFWTMAGLPRSITVDASV
jgi:hypothetical protein